MKLILDSESSEEEKYEDLECIDERYFLLSWSGDMMISTIGICNISLSL